MGATKDLESQCLPRCLPHDIRESQSGACKLYTNND